MSTMDEGAMVIIKKCKSAISHKLLSVIIKKKHINLGKGFMVDYHRNKYIITEAKPRVICFLKPSS